MSEKKRWKKLWLQVIKEASKHGADYLNGMMTALAPGGLKQNFHDENGKVSARIKKLDRKLKKLWKLGYKRDKEKR